MSLLEWLFERRNPGPTGSIDLEPPDEYALSRPIKTVRAMLALTALGGAAFLIVKNVGGPMEIGFALGALVFYLVLAFLFQPKPDYSNVGLLGGMIDHPFRWSDDVNRFLLFLRILLFPGRLVGIGLRDALDLMTGRRVIRL